MYLPVLSNPLNQIGWSDLVSKDLMDKFHNFLAHLYVTIGQVKGRTMLPLPPNDVTSSDKTSSKDKAHILEGKIRLLCFYVPIFLIWNPNLDYLMFAGNLKFEFRRNYHMDQANQKRVEAGPRVCSQGRQTPRPTH